MVPKPIYSGLSRAVYALRFIRPVACSCNLLDCARRSLARYLGPHSSAPRVILLPGMNPGAFGMARTGVPFS